jgi:hypothetical protein
MKNIILFSVTLSLAACGIVRDRPVGCPDLSLAKPVSQNEAFKALPYLSPERYLFLDQLLSNDVVKDTEVMLEYYWLHETEVLYLGSRKFLSGRGSSLLLSAGGEYYFTLTINGKSKIVRFIWDSYEPNFVEYRNVVPGISAQPSIVKTTKQ